MDFREINNYEILFQQHKWHISLSDILEDELESTSSKALNRGLYIQALFCIALEDTKRQLKCLDVCGNKAKYSLGVLKKKEVTNKAIDIVYKKLEINRKYIHDVIHNTLAELVTCQSFNTLKNNVLKTADNYRYKLILDEAINKLQFKNLIKQLRRQQNRYKLKLYDTNKTIENLKRELDDTYPLFEVKSRYVRNWQVARTEQQEMVIANKESTHCSNITYYKKKYEQEEKAHREIELLMNVEISAIFSKIENIMDKYDGDMERIDLKIHITKNEFLNIQDKRLEIEEMLKRRNIEIKKWIYFKEERRRSPLYQEKMGNAASVIQAWWRGLLLRLELGPFTVKKAKINKRKK